MTQTGARRGPPPPSSTYNLEDIAAWGGHGHRSYNPTPTLFNSEKYLREANDIAEWIRSPSCAQPTGLTPSQKNYINDKLKLTDRNTDDILSGKGARCAWPPYLGMFGSPEEAYFNPYYKVQLSANSSDYGGVKTIMQDGSVRVDRVPLFPYETPYMKWWEEESVRQIKAGTPAGQAPLVAEPTSEDMFWPIYKLTFPNGKWWKMDDYMSLGRGSLGSCRVAWWQGNTAHEYEGGANQMTAEQRAQAAANQMLAHSSEWTSSIGRSLAKQYGLPPDAPVFNPKTNVVDIQEPQEPQLCHDIDYYYTDYYINGTKNLGNSPNTCSTYLQTPCPTYDPTSNPEPTNVRTPYLTIQNCSLPIIEHPTKYGFYSSAGVLDNIDDYKNVSGRFFGINNKSALANRDTQNPWCVYYPNPTVLGPIPFSEYTKPTDIYYDPPTDYGKNPLWIIPTNPPQKHPIFNKGHNNFKFLKYYAAKLPGQNSNTTPINRLFTQDGRETIHTFAVPTQILVPYPSIDDSSSKQTIINSYIFNGPTNTNIAAPSPTYCNGKGPNVNPPHPLCVYPSPYSSRILNISELVKDINDNFSCKTAIHESLGSECITSSTETMDACILGDSMVQLHCGSNAPQIVEDVVSKYNLVQSRIEPWLHLGQEQQPANYGSNIKPEANINNPYGDSFTNCKPNPGGNSPLSRVTFTKINEADQIEFFKPRFGSQGVNHIFSHRGDNSEYSFGCIRDDIMNVEESYFDLSCNTNTRYPIERNKFVLINRIIEASIQANPTSPKLNISDRTKLVLMDEEELLFKASELGLNMEDLNQYTKPKLTSRVKDIYDPNTSKFEIWDDLESNYLNIDPPPLNASIPKLGVKEWEFTGCGLDFNNIDNSRSYETCKDKYPGLCQRNIALCKSTNQSINEAIHRDCPETCKSQFNSLSQFENKQIGDLSICSERGRCKWSRDQDDANLLPYCDQDSARDYGDNDKCVNFKNKKVGSCKINDNTLNCMREKCLSMTGCEFTAGNPDNVCLISNRIRNDMSAEDCNHHQGTWSGRTGELGTCIIPAYSDTSLTEQQCNAIQGTYIPKSDSTCLFNSHNWTPLEDPCQMPHNVNFNALTDQQKSQYPNKLSESINIDHIEPECIGSETEIEECQQGRKHPSGFKITLVDPISSLIEGDYIHITTQQLSDNCSPYLVGYSKVLKVLEGGKSFIINGPNESYTLERSLFDSTQYDIGSCVVDEQYRVFTTSTPDSIQVCKDKAVSTGSSCTYIDSEDPMMKSNICKSCSLIESRDECITDNRVSSCGWGELRDVCEVIGDIGACNDMYSEGCYWDHDKQTCLLNQYRKTEGCMKCSDLEYKHTCNSLSNCFWKNNQCQSCGETFPGTGPTTMPTAQSCNRESDGQCQWRNEQGEGEFRCRPVDPYPLIYEWIWYNKWLLVSIFLVLYFFIKLPLGTASLGLRGSAIATIVLFIVRIILIFVVLPGLFIVPGITRADGKDGRKYYVDPPLNPNKPGYLDFLHDENMEGALWPATIYDNRWDDKIMDDDTLRSIVDFEIYPESLNWSEYLFWTPIRKWNTLMNNNTGKTTIFFFFMIMGFVFILYSGSFYKLKDITTHSKRTYILLFVIISVLVWLEYLENTYQERKYSDDLANNKSKYYGRQTTAYPSDSILNIFSSIPTQDNALNPIHVCPYGCRLYTDTSPLPSNSPNIFPSPTLYPECGDTRSLFSFKGDLDPDAKKIITDPYDPSDPISLQKWKIYQGDTGVNHICPVKQEYYKWPYDNMCKDKHHQCVADDKYEVATPTDITQPVNPSPGLKDVNKRGDEFKNKLDEMCRQQYNTYDTCDPYSVSKLSFNETSDTTNITSKINVNCTFKDKDDNWLSCPFPENTVYLEYAEGEQRLPIKGWQTLWDKIAGVTPRRLGKAEKIKWQNEERYEIVDQNFSVDHN